MSNVKLYLSNEQKSMKPTMNRAMWLLEAENGKTLHGFITMTATRNFFELIVFIAALLKLKKPCHVTVFSQNEYLKNLVNDNLPMWESNGWRKKRGDPLKYKEAYMVLKNLTKTHEMEFRPGEKHSFTGWMESELSHCDMEQDMFESIKEKLNERAAG